MKYANLHGYSDVTPYEIIRHVSPTTIEVREMSAERANPENDLGPSPDGRHRRQDEQEWVITPCPENRVIRIRLSKAKRKAGYWFDKYENKFALAEAPRKFYDYNF